MGMRATAGTVLWALANSYARGCATSSQRAKNVTATTLPSNLLTQLPKRDSARCAVDTANVGRDASFSDSLGSLLALPIPMMRALWLTVGLTILGGCKRDARNDKPVAPLPVPA